MPLVSKSFSDIITFTRASSGTYFDATGTLQTATTNTARFYYNPSTLAAMGMLVEEQRTNSIRNNTMQGAVAGTPGTLPTNWSSATSLTGLTQQIVGTGTESGISFIDIKLSGTPSAAGSFRYYFETQTGIGALTGQIWSGSYYIKLAAGSTTGISGFTDIYQEFTLAGVYVTEAGLTATTPTASGLSGQRNTTSRTLAGGATVAYVRSGIQLNLTGVAIDITLRIGLPQLEQGAFATSVISTSTAAATRSADVASVNTLSPWYNASSGALYAEMQMLASPTTPVSIPFSFSGVNSSITLRMRPNAKGGAAVIDNSVTVVDTSSSGSYTTGVSKLALGYSLNDFATTLNGEAVVTDTSGTVPTVSSMGVGSFGGSSYLNGYLRRLTYYPRRLSNAELQGITA